MTDWKFWLGFNLFVCAMLALDLGVFHRKSHTVKWKEALAWSGVWIALALVFNAVIYFWKGGEAAMQFFTGYLIEKSLSVDNIFVFLLIFAYFRVPPGLQHKVLFWGILGALAMRAIFIFAGIALLERFDWMIYVFGALLIVTGIKMALQKGKELHPERNPMLRLFRRAVPTTDEYHGDKFFVRLDASTFATPLLVALLFVEISDLIFAVDSIPAILAITTDPFLVYTSNVFAILGLRSLYFALSGIVEMFHYLHYGLAAILTFVGGKMVAAEFYHVPIGVSLGVIAAILLLSITASIAFPDKRAHALPGGA
jgi:tellurite resistance protein TerC